MLVNFNILFYQQLVTETNYYRLIKARSRALQATLTSANTDTESNFRTLFAILHKSCRCPYEVRSRLVEEVSVTREFSALELRIGLLSSFSPWKKMRKCSLILKIEVMNRCDEQILIWICIMSLFVTFGYLITLIRKNEQTSKCLQNRKINIWLNTYLNSFENMCDSNPNIFPHFSNLLKGKN